MDVWLLLVIAVEGPRDARGCALEALAGDEASLFPLQDALIDGGYEL